MKTRNITCVAGYNKYRDEYIRDCDEKNTDSTWSEDEDDGHKNNEDSGKDRTLKTVIRIISTEDFTNKTFGEDELNAGRYKSSSLVIVFLWQRCRH